MNTGQEKVTSKNGLLTTLACGPKGEPAYALEGAVFMVVPLSSGYVMN